MKREGVWLDGRWIDRDQVEQCRELVEEMRGKREEWERQRELIVKAWSNFQAGMRPFFERWREAAKKIMESPAWLDVRMFTGGYEEDLMESHGDAEDVWV